MLRYELPIVPAGINVRLMRNAPLAEQPVHLARTGGKTVIIMIAAIKVNLHALQMRAAGKDKRRILLPEALVQRRAKRASQKGTET